MPPRPSPFHSHDRSASAAFVSFPSVPVPVPVPVLSTPGSRKTFLPGKSELKKFLGAKVQTRARAISSGRAGPRGGQPAAMVIDALPVFMATGPDNDEIAEIGWARTGEQMMERYAKLLNTYFGIPGYGLVVFAADIFSQGIDAKREEQARRAEEQNAQIAALVSRRAIPKGPVPTLFTPGYTYDAADWLKVLGDRTIRYAYFETMTLHLLVDQHMEIAAELGKHVAAGMDAEVRDAMICDAEADVPISQGTTVVLAGVVQSRIHEVGFFVPSSGQMVCNPRAPGDVWVEGDGAVYYWARKIAHAPEYAHIKYVLLSSIDTDLLVTGLLDADVRDNVKMVLELYYRGTGFYFHLSRVLRAMVPEKYANMLTPHMQTMYWASFLAAWTSVTGNDYVPKLSYDMNEATHIVGKMARTAESEYTSAPGAPFMDMMDIASLVQGEGEGEGKWMQVQINPLALAPGRRLGRAGLLTRVHR